MDSKENDKDKVKGKGKAKAKEIFPWTDELNILLMKICKDYQSSHGYNQSFAWNTITSDFEKQSGMKLTSKSCARNKIEHMKKLWKPWCALRNHVTGGGWDPCTGQFTMDDEWWDRQKKTKNDKFSQFRKKGVHPELSDLWDDVFGQIVATGKHVVSPSMEPSSVPVLGITQDETIACSDKENSLDAILSRDLVDDSVSFQALVARVNVDLPYDQYLAEVHQSVTDNVSELHSGPSMPKGKAGKISLVSPEQVVKRRKKKATGSSLAFNEHMKFVGETGQKILSILEGEVGSSATAKEVPTYTYNECIKRLQEIVETGDLTEDSPIWCFAASQLKVEAMREVFMKYEYQIANNIYQPSSSASQ